MDFLREAPEATGDEPEDTELEAPKVSALLSCSQHLSAVSLLSSSV